ncbi:ankyrin [Thozetella sp. PMI_491]|nr:ankyrin [Thozetella sp. PMI_491]
MVLPNFSEMEDVLYPQAPSKCASLEMLGWLFGHGAKTDALPLPSGFATDDSNVILFFVENSSNLIASSIFEATARHITVNFRYERRGHRYRDVQRLLETRTSFNQALQLLIKRGLPIFPLNEPLRDHRQFNTPDHPLSLFILGGADLKFIILVLETGIDVNGAGADPHLGTPLLAAIQTGNGALIQELVARGAEVNDGYSLGAVLRSQGSDIRLVELLLSYGADPNAETSSGRIAFHEVLTHCDPCLGPRKREIVERLLTYGAKVNARALFFGPDSLGPSSLEIFCSHSCDECISTAQLLLERGAEVDTPANHQGGNALMRACQRRHIALIKLLLHHKANPNQKSWIRKHKRAFEELKLSSPLIESAARGDIAIVLLLLAAGAKLPTTEADHPLVAAAAEGKLDTVALLLGLQKERPILERAIREASRNGHAVVVAHIQQHIWTDEAPAREQQVQEIQEVHDD